LKKTDIIDAFAVGTGNIIESAIVPGFVDSLGVNHKKAIAIGQFVEPPFCHPHYATIRAAAAM
jgi:hypothetical protein